MPRALLESAVPIRPRVRRPKRITKANRRPVRAKWPPAPARVRAILDGLEALYPDVDCELDRDTPFQLLCATILSAQCTDERVNKVTPELFRRFPDAARMAKARPAELEAIIRSTGFFRQKAKSLKATATLLVEQGGELPRTIAELTRLPGVARKTANVVRGEAFGLADGVVVDTHVTRLAGRLGLTRHKDPVKIEQDLMALLPREEWISFSHRLIRLGRTVCVARKPRCPECPLAVLCPRIGVKD